MEPMLLWNHVLWETYYYESSNIMELANIMEPSAIVERCIMKTQVLWNQVLWETYYYESPNIMELASIMEPSAIIERCGLNHYTLHPTCASLATKLGKPVWRGETPIMVHKDC